MKSWFVWIGLASVAVAQSPPNLELHLDAKEGFALYRPKGWQVGVQHFPNGRMISVAAPSGDTMATMTSLSTQDRSNNSVNFATLTIQNVRENIPDLKLNWSKSAKNRQRTVVDWQYTNVRNVLNHGRYYFSVNFPEARLLAIEAPVAQFDRLKPLLLTVISNITFLDGKLQRTAAGTQPVEPIQLQLVRRTLPDRTASMLAPPNWTFTGQKGAALCVSPDERAGFAFANAEYMGRSNIPYFNSAVVRGVRYAAYKQPVDALQMVMGDFGATGIRVEKRFADRQRAQNAARALNRGVDVESAVMTSTSRRGVRMKGFYDVVGLRPLASGQWGIIYFGIWSPEAEFERYQPVLAQMAQSYAINEAWAAEYIRNGLARLREMMAETRRRMAETATAVRRSSYEAFQERMRSWDYIDYKRTMTIRGEQEWVSRLEGGALYKSDRWGLSREGERIAEGRPFNYHNYRGESPRYNETMTPVDVSRQVYESVYGR